MWTFVYNLLRVFSEDSGNNIVTDTVTMKEGLSERLLPSSTSNVNMMGKEKVVFLLSHFIF